MRRGLASEIFPMRLSGRPQDPDVRFCAPMAASAEARSAPSGVHPCRRVRRRGTWTESLRRGRAADKGFPLSRGPLPRRVRQEPPRGYSRPPALYRGTDHHGRRRRGGCRGAASGQIGALAAPSGLQGKGPADPGPGRLKGRIGRSFEPARSRAAIPSSGARGSGGGGLKMWRQPHPSACAQAHAAGGHLNIAQIMRGLRREAQVRTVGGVRGRRCLLAEPTAHNPCVMFQCPPKAPFQGDGGGLPPAMACGRH